MTPEVEALAQRLEEVEKQLAHLAALVTELSDSDRTISARRFVVRDEQGKQRAELGMMTAEGEAKARPALALFDENGVGRAHVGWPETGPEIQLSHPKTETKVIIGALENGSALQIFDSKSKLGVSVETGKNGPCMSLFGPDEKRRLQLGLGPAGEPVVRMADGNEKVRLALWLSASGEPVVRAHDANGTARLEFFVTESGETGLEMGDASGKLRLRIKSPASGGPTLDMYDGNGQPRAGLKLSPSGEPWFQLLDTEGTPRLQMIADSAGAWLLAADGSENANAGVTLAVDNNGPYLALSKRGKVIWSAR